MTETHLIYTGPVEECGFTGPVTGNSYVCHPGEPFAVDPADADKLLVKWRGLLARHEPIQHEPAQEYKRYARRAAPDDPETSESAISED
jgi:hypothetical protein